MAIPTIAAAAHVLLLFRAVCFFAFVSNAGSSRFLLSHGLLVAFHERTNMLPSSVFLLLRLLLLLALLLLKKTKKVEVGCLAMQVLQ
jgi:hypothetical protein